MHVWHNGNGNPSEWIDSLPGEGFFFRNGTAAQYGMDECGRKDPEEEDNELFEKHLRNHDSVNEVDQNAQNMQMTVSVISSGLLIRM